MGDYAVGMLLAAAYVHRLDPVLIDFGHGIAIRWYGLSYLAGFAIGWLLLRWMVKAGRTWITMVQLGDLLTALIIGVLVGGRVGHVLFYDQWLLMKFSSTFPWWGLLEINNGGMSSHGGIIGVILACLWCGRKFKVTPWHLLDLAALACGPGLGMGRLANFINGELPGKLLPAAMQANPPWWSVKFPSEALEPEFLNRPEVQALRPPGVALDDLGILLHRAILNRDPGLGEAAVQLLPARYPSQLLQALTDGVILVAVLVLVWWRPRKPGVVAGWFTLTYGVLRMTTEQLRVPDLDPFTIRGVTLPMSLSVTMIVGGFVLITWASQRPSAKTGGLSARAI